MVPVAEMTVFVLYYTSYILPGPQRNPSAAGCFPPQEGRSEDNDQNTQAVSAC